MSQNNKPLQLIGGPYAGQKLKMKGATTTRFSCKGFHGYYRWQDPDTAIWVRELPHANPQR